MLLASLNLQYMGRVEEAVTCLEPTAAQRRVQTTMHLFVESFLREDLRFSGEQIIRGYLRQPMSGLDAGMQHVRSALESQTEPEQLPCRMSCVIMRMIAHFQGEKKALAEQCLRSGEVKRRGSGRREPDPHELPLE